MSDCTTLTFLGLPPSKFLYPFNTLSFLFALTNFTVIDGGVTTSRPLRLTVFILFSFRWQAANHCCSLWHRSWINYIIGIFYYNDVLIYCNCNCIVFYYIISYYNIILYYYYIITFILYNILPYYTLCQHIIIAVYNYYIFLFVSVWYFFPAH